MSADGLVQIYTDGACSPNPGPGGYGVILCQAGQRSELSGGFNNTTNNRMEILAAIEGLKAVTAADQDITVYSDSGYLVNMFNGGHAERWRSRGWMRDKKDRAKNEDLWGALLDIAARHRVRFEWIKSHNEHPENERCDWLAVEARKRDGLPPDTGYKSPPVQTVPQQQMLFDVL